MLVPVCFFTFHCLLFFFDCCQISSLPLPSISLSSGLHGNYYMTWFLHCLVVGVVTITRLGFASLVVGTVTIT